MADPDSRAGVRYVDPALLAYVERVHAGHDPALAQAFSAPEKQGMPQIQVSPSEGKLLELLVRMIGARKAVEVGTLAGYSAIHIARGLPDDGQLFTIEFDPKHAAVARANIEAAGLSRRIQVCEGAGVEVLPTLERYSPFDAMFLDADKQGYPDYAAWGARNLRKGGLLLADNSYYFGQLLGDEPPARAMRRFHEQLPAAFDSVCVPTPDGLVLGIRR